MANDLVKTWKTVSGFVGQITGRENSTSHRALAESNKGFGREFAGIQVHGSVIQVHAKIHINQPKVAPHHSSSAYVAIESGSGKRFNEIQVGWTINPDLFGDDRVHFYVKYTADNNRVCFNTKCKIFKQVAKDVIGSVLTSSNVSQNIQKDLSIYLVQEKDRNWWLYVTPNKIKVGYWDKKYFCTLQEVATTVRFGGEVFIPQNSISSPPMGSGVFMKSYVYYETCYFSDIQVNEDDTYLQDSKVIETRCYFVGNVGRGGPQGFGFLFGGVGGKDMETCVY